MSEMIEQVARALVDTDRGTGTYDRCKSEGIWQSEIVMWEFRARTAIEAMEATEAMLIAAFSWDEHVGMEETYPMYRGIFRAMMKAALKEQTK